MVRNTTTSHDVVIIGGGPSGTTAATLLKKYNPDLRVLIIEKAEFPREHIGESQLPSIMPILHEMGVWDKIEAANFPIKLGASYTWGRNHDRWNFEFYPVEQWKNEPRPGKFEGQRKYTAFQVERSIYDDILLTHAKEMGAECRQPCKVDKVLYTGDRIDGLQLNNGEVVTGRYYIDGSGTVAMFRRELNIPGSFPEELQNIAIWDYWDNAEWAEEIGVGGTRIQVRSLPYGWIWFIPLGPTRTSIGVICPAAHYKKMGKSTTQLYNEAIQSQPDIANLIRNATSGGEIRAAKDWSNLSDRAVGENWFICGEAAGFADPILSAGMTLAHASSRDAAYTILELDRGQLDPLWLRERYDERTRTNISQHIRFARFWYSANGCFTELREHCATIAKEAGLSLTPAQAWRWLSQGGFSAWSVRTPSFGSFDIASAKQVIELFDAAERKCEMLVDGHNVFKLNLFNAKKTQVGDLRDGKIELVDCFEKGGKLLPDYGYFNVMRQVLEQTSDAAEMFQGLQAKISAEIEEPYRARTLNACIQTLEAMVMDGWVMRSKNKKRPMFHAGHDGNHYVRSVEAAAQAVEEAGASGIIKSRI